MNGYENGLIFAVGLAHLAAVGCILYFRLFWRFPWLTAHLLFEGVFQVLDPTLAGHSARDLVWVCGQAPRMLLRGAVVWEVWREASIDLDVIERKGLALVCALTCLLAGAVALFAILLLPAAAASQAHSAFAVLLLIRQYLLLICATWLIVLNAYLLLTRIGTDHNLTLYRGFATMSASVIFAASTFVLGGLGYHLLPWARETWSLIHVWQCWYSLILIAVLTIFLRSEVEPAN